MSRFNINDWNTAHRTWKGLQAPCDSPDCYDNNGDLRCDCDCQTSEIVVLSTGYAEVWYDGDVLQHGQVLFNVAR